ncbi:MAG TPA: DNA mismatch repair protein MutS [Verrucomicrobiae bacterium]|nr:DNA mismatch repair protein MutS [Verrucomicrobiae bacterium]
MDPLKEYQTRLAVWQQKADRHELLHRRLGNLRLGFVFFLLVFAVWLCQSQVAVGWVFVTLVGGIFSSGMLHDTVLNRRDHARRAVGFYKAGLDRLTDAWRGKGSSGSEFLDPHHPYAADLDLFGKGSLFELLNTAQTHGGQAMLAGWLLRPGAPEEIQARHAIVDELRPMLDLRERLGVLAEEAQKHIKTDSLAAWARQPPILESGPVRAAAFCLPWLNLGLFIYAAVNGDIWLFGITFTAQLLIAWRYQQRVNKVIRSIDSPARDLIRLAGLLGCFERQQFHAAGLQQLQAACRSLGISAGESIRRLARLSDWLEWRDNYIAAPFCAFALWGTQFAFAIEAWRANFGPMIEVWLRSLAEFEALCSLASYAFEHPSDPFPKLIVDSTSMTVQADGLGHPLIAETRCVRNDARLGPDCRLLVISGSNMSGKSTYLRALGVNIVLAMAGAPVRSRELRMTPLQIGASMRAVDSLQEGVSRFYSEISRLQEIVKLTNHAPPVLFLLDELLSGTNSHDRRVGAASIVRSLVQRGAMGLVTTHDLALTQIVEQMEPKGANFHFEDQFENGRLNFDYRLRPGIVEKSNALELMRAIGLEV